MPVWTNMSSNVKGIRVRICELNNSVTITAQMLSSGEEGQSNTVKWLTTISLSTFSASVSTNSEFSSMLLVTKTSPPDIMLRWLPAVPHRRPLVSADELVSLRGGVSNVPFLPSESYWHTNNVKLCPMSLSSWLSRCVLYSHKLLTWPWFNCPASSLTSVMFNAVHTCRQTRGFGIVVSMLASINEVNLRRARLVLRWATVSDFNSRCRTFISVCNQPATEPPKANSAFHPSGVGKWVPASVGKAKAGMVHSISDVRGVCR